MEKAHFVIVLACSVRQSAIDRVWGKLNLWKTKKTIFIIGCVLPTDQKRLAKKYPFLRILVTEDFVKQIPDLFPPPTTPTLRKTIYKPTGCVNGFENKRFHKKQETCHAFVTIQFGCDNFCTYCAVPYTRGREKSRPSKSIIADIKKEIQNGKNYFTLLGQNVNSYGLSQKEKQKNIQNLRQLTGDWLLLENEKNKITQNKTGSFADLLWQIDKIQGVKKLDFLSPNPQDMTNDVIDWMGKSQKFSHKLNLPLQSGSDKILHKMNRRYTAKQYLTLVQKIKKAVPDIELTTDIIVGFPSETESDFKKTCNLCKLIGFKQIYIGKYSPRNGTVAQKFFEDDVSFTEKKARYKKLIKLTS